MDAYFDYSLEELKFLTHICSALVDDAFLGEKL